MQRIKKHVSPGLVISFIALFVVLGGGAYAITAKPKSNSVGAKALKILNTRTATTTIPATSPGVATASCVGKEQFISGGARFSVTPGTAIDFMHMEGNGWRVVGFNFLATPVTMTAEAYCLKK